MSFASEVLTWLLIFACVGSGMMAGLFASFSSFMMKALSSLPDACGMQAMQAINRHILRPSFLVIFFGTGLLCLLAIPLAWPQPEIRMTVLAAAAVYVVGCLGITMAFNVPLNNQLEKTNPDTQAGRVLWNRYLSRWTRWNHLRAVATLLSTFLLVLAVFDLGVVVPD